MGAVTRTVLETMRTLFVWVADLALYYSPLGGSGKVGEQWDSHSWLQARGALSCKEQCSCSRKPSAANPPQSDPR